MISKTETKFQSYRSVEFTLTHLHVTRFHHAGDVSDDEDEDVSVHENADPVNFRISILFIQKTLFLLGSLKI